MTLKNSLLLPALVCTVLLQVGCGSDDDSDTAAGDTSGEETTPDPTDETPDETPDEPGTDGDTSGVVGNFDSSMFGDDLLSVGEESCTLDDGTVTTCMSLVFAANGAGGADDSGIGPYCPESITTPRIESGFGTYDGATTPGFQSMVDAAIAMEADGYDIVDDNGNINFDDLSGAAVTGLSYCLSPTFESDIEITYLIPITPEFRAEPAVIGTIDSMGVGVLGVPYKGNPPSVTTVEAGIGGTGSGNIPATDHCGGHPDPFGYYHWHLIPQGANNLWASENYPFTEDFGITCSNPTIDVDGASSFAGLAKDGFPLYGPLDSVNGVDTSPSEVATTDSCDGHSHATDEFPDGVYHYHAQTNTVPNLPSCLMGKFVDRDITIGGSGGGGGAPPSGGPPQQ